MPQRRYLPVLLVAALGLACGDQLPFGPDTSSAPRIGVFRSEILIGIGNELALNSVAYAIPDGASDQRITWSTSDSATVALVAGPSASAIGLREGNAVLTARRGTASANIPIVVRADASVVVIEEFHVLEEIASTSETTVWGYAPKLRLRASTSSPPAAIAGWDLVIPGLEGTLGCRSDVTLFAGAAFELFPEAYGDYTYQFGSIGARATAGAQASIRVRVLAREGTTVYVRAQGPVVPAPGPPAYYGKLVAGVCLFP